MGEVRLGGWFEEGRLRVEHRMVKVGDLQFHVMEAGPADGWPIVLLHGFPEYSGAWNTHMQLLAAKGWRVIVPDQRGYNLSDAPQAVKAYHLDRLSEDVLGIMDALSVKTAVVVGHDWGGAVAWWLGIHHAARLERLIVLDCPHLAVMSRDIWRPKQLLRSSYMLLFQLPGIAEWVCRRDGFLFLRCALKMAKNTPHLPVFSAEDIARYVQAWSQPGVLTGMLNWYRAALQSLRDLRKAGRVAVPTLVLWGGQDPVLRKDLASSSVAMCDDGHLVVIDDATHWIQHEYPEQVCAWIDAFSRGEPVG